MEKKLPFLIFFLIIILSFVLISCTSKSIQYFLITWKNDDGTILKVDEVKAQTIPNYSGLIPSKLHTDAFVYYFSGWTPKVEPATKNVTYTAVYTQVENAFIVRWEDYDGTLIKEDYGLSYLSMPYFSGNLPKGYASEKYYYTFDKWSPQFEPITNHTTYKAQYYAWNINIYNLRKDLEQGDLTAYYILQILANSPYNSEQAVLSLKTLNSDYLVELIESGSKDIYLVIKALANLYDNIQAKEHLKTIDYTYYIEQIRHGDVDAFQFIRELVIPSRSDIVQEFTSLNTDLFEFYDENYYEVAHMLVMLATLYENDNAITHIQRLILEGNSVIIYSLNMYAPSLYIDSKSILIQANPSAYQAKALQGDNYAINSLIYMGKIGNEQSIDAIVELSKNCNPYILSGLNSIYFELGHEKIKQAIKDLAEAENETMISIIIDNVRKDQSQHSNLYRNLLIDAAEKGNAQVVKSLLGKLDMDFVQTLNLTAFFDRHQNLNYFDMSDYLKIVKEYSRALNHYAIEELRKCGTHTTFLILEELFLAYRYDEYLNPIISATQEGNLKALETLIHIGTIINTSEITFLLKSINILEYRPMVEQGNYEAIESIFNLSMWFGNTSAFDMLIDLAKLGNSNVFMYLVRYYDLSTKIQEAFDYFDFSNLLKATLSADLNAYNGLKALALQFENQAVFDSLSQLNLIPLIENTNVKDIASKRHILYELDLIFKNSWAKDSEKLFIIDIEQHIDLVENGDLESYRFLISSMTHEIRLRLMNVDVSAIVRLVELGHYEACDILVELAYYHNNINAALMIKQIDLSVFLHLAEDGDLNAINLIMRFAESYNHQQAPILLENMDMTTLVNIYFTQPMERYQIGQIDNLFLTLITKYNHAQLLEHIISNFKYLHKGSSIDLFFNLQEYKELFLLRDRVVQLFAEQNFFSNPITYSEATYHKKLAFDLLIENAKKRTTGNEISIMVELLKQGGNEIIREKIIELTEQGYVKSLSWINDVILPETLNNLNLEELIRLANLRESYALNILIELAEKHHANAILAIQSITFDASNPFVVEGKDPAEVVCVIDLLLTLTRFGNEQAIHIYYSFVEDGVSHAVRNLHQLALIDDERALIKLVELIDGGSEEALFSLSDLVHQGSQSAYHALLNLSNRNIELAIMTFANLTAGGFIESSIGDYTSLLNTHNKYAVYYLISNLSDWSIEFKIGWLTKHGYIGGNFN